MSTYAPWTSRLTGTRLTIAASALLNAIACAGEEPATSTPPPPAESPAASSGKSTSAPSAGQTAAASNTMTAANPATAPMAGSGAMPAANSGAIPSSMGSTSPAAMGSADPAVATTPTTPPAMMPSTDPPPYHDPGTGAWEMASPEECKMDVGMMQPGQNIAVFRYGKLCHTQGGNTTGANWSATKTLGGVLAGRAAYLVKDVPRTGPGTGPILHEDKAVDWLGTVSYNREALLSHIMAMVGHNPNLAFGSKSFSYDTVGSVQITDIVRVAMVATAQVPGLTTNSVEFMNTEVFAKLGMKDSNWPGGTIGYGWTGTLEDMGRVGVMLAHDGWYGGERFMEASWVYRMSHPAHEDANTAYGQLAWLGNRGGGASFGATVDDCAPAAFWPSYPHVGSEAPDCGSTDGNCKQKYDVGYFDAAGLGGQYIVVHPGLDLVMAAHNASSAAGVWAAVRPAIVAKDPMFMGDEAAFCAAYGAGDYAPDLLAPRVAPTK